MTEYLTLDTELHGRKLTSSMLLVINGCLRPGDIVNNETISIETLVALYDCVEVTHGNVLDYQPTFPSDLIDPIELVGKSETDAMELLMTSRPCPIPLDKRIKAYMAVRRQAKSKTVA